jgi:hypothetical protein
MEALLGKLNNSSLWSGIFSLRFKGRDEKCEPVHQQDGTLITTDSGFVEGDVLKSLRGV